MNSIHRLNIFLLVIVLCASAFPALAQDTLLTVPEPDVEKELAAFEVAEGFEVNLFASEPMIANPIHMNWDDEGRLWVVGSAVYPHISPDQQARDTITILEDTDGDGQADKSTIFAENLFIPTGIVPGDGGVYVANSTELLFMKDTDGDGRADETRVVLSGFGTEDTHHILHSLRWGYDGLMYMNQSIYIHSHIETPHGVRRLNAGGIWQFRPETMELEVFTRGQINPWGHHYDEWGQSFSTDGAFYEGINYLFPGAAFMTVHQIPRVVSGLNKGMPKFSGLEILSGNHLPEDWRGTMITNDFRGHRVCRFVVTDEAGGYTSVEQEEVLKTHHVAFRPVDTKMGPDGAIYIADWYNPIIQHGEVAFRDPRRDHEHGRIWRVTAKDRPLVKRPDFRKASIDDLIALLKSEEHWNRIHAKRELKTRDRDQVIQALGDVLSRLGTFKNFENFQLEVLWTYQTMDEVNPELLSIVLNSQDYRARAAGVRVLSQWKSRLNDEATYVQQLTKLVEDDHARVRLEAVRALAKVENAQAADIAMRVKNTEGALDKNLEYALWTTLRDLKAQWLPLVESDELTFTKNYDHLLYALNAIDSGEAVEPLLNLYTGDVLNDEQHRLALNDLVKHADAVAMGKVLAFILAGDADQASILEPQLNHLINAAKRRGITPDTDLSGLGTLINGDHAGLRKAGIRAAGEWKLETFRPTLTTLAQSSDTQAGIRIAAINALAALGGEESVTVLDALATSETNTDLRTTAVMALLKVSTEKGATQAVALLSKMNDEDPTSLYKAILKTEGAPAALSDALEGTTLNPEIARIGERVITSSGRKENDLLYALSTAGGLDAARAELSPNEMTALVNAVQTNGDAARGRKHYRALNCVQCHAIAGAGGMLGPDLTSIGGSAQIDYLIDSNYFPDKAIKEGFHSLIVETKDYELYSGIKVGETATELILRDATNPEIRIPLDTIETRDDGGSLMPTGLADSLLENEFIDLVRYLSELGRTPEFSAGTGRHARVWRVLSNTASARDYIYETKPEAALEPHESLIWDAAFSYVTGNLPLKKVPIVKHGYSKTPYSYLKFSLEASAAGKVALSIQPVEGARLWGNGKAVPVSDQTLVDVTNGKTECILILDRSQAKGDVDIQLVDDPQATVTAQFVGGL